MEFIRKLNGIHNSSFEIFNSLAPMFVVMAAYHVIDVLTTGYAVNGHGFVSYAAIDDAPTMMSAIGVMKRVFVYVTDYPI